MGYSNQLTVQGWIRVNPKFKVSDPVRERRDIETRRKRLCKDGGRRERAATRRGTPEMASSHQKRGAMGWTVLQSIQREPALLILTFSGLAFGTVRK